MKHIFKRISFYLPAIVFVTLVSSSAAYAAYGSVWSSTTVPYYAGQWGTHGSGNGQFTSPRGVAVGSNGNVYVLDSGNKRVEEFTSGGTYITQWGSSGSGDGQFIAPLAIAANITTGNVYVSDGFNDNIQEFTSNGTYMTQWGSGGSGSGQFSNPTGIAVAANGNVYIADGDNNNVQEFTSSGTYLTQWGSFGSGNGQFETLASVAIDSSGNVYVTDTGNFRVEKFTSGGTYITQWGSFGSGNGQFVGGYSIAVSNQGYVYVGDISNNNVQVFTTNGVYLTQWGSAGSGNGQFNEPYGGAIALNGVGYIVDTYNNRIQEFAAPNNLGTVMSYNGASTININLPTTDNIYALESMAGSGNDSGYTLPLGLVSFTINSSVGGTVPVTLSFQTSLTPSQVIAQKYNPSTQKYTTIPGAVTTETTVNGQPGLQLTYNITDGGPLDEDGVANGVIVDPVGLAMATSAPVAAPDTGHGSPTRHEPIITLLAISAVVSTGAGFVLFHRSTKRLHN